MTSIRIRYHHEDEGWWADSEDLPGWTAAGSDFAEVREQARSGVAKFAGPQVLLVEEGAPSAPTRPEFPPGRPPRPTE